MPLAGRRVVVTRAKEQSGELADHLRRLGAEVVELPVIALAPVEDLGPLEDALARLNEYRWVVFTSVNGVRWFFELAGQRAQGMSDVRVAAVGPATAAALRERGIEASVLPEEFVAESLAEALLREAIDGARVLLPRAASARDVLPDALRAKGAVVDDVPVYRNIVPPELAEAAEALFSGAGRPDWVTLTSSSTVKNLLAAVGHERLAGVKLASIGPVTTATAVQHGLEITAEAEPYTLDGLVDALLREG
jgi:uroporphyrinogen-III synthase